MRAAIAYFGGSGAKLLLLKKGDSIVLDMSIGAVRQGVTNPRAVRTLIGRGVKVFTRNSLHAKFLIIDKTLIASSANASTNSKEILDEAGIITTDTASVLRATDFFHKLCVEPVRQEYLKKCIAEYCPPKFKSAIEHRQPRSKRSARIVEAKLWFVGGVESLSLSENTRKATEQVERRHKKHLKRPGQTEVGWIRYHGKPKILRHLRIGDWVVDCTKEGVGQLVGPPSQFLGFDELVTDRGTKYTMVMLERHIDGESMSLTNFRRKIRATQPALNRSNPRTKAITDNDHADSILRLWATTGKIAKSRSA